MAADKTILIKLDVQEANANNRINTLKASLKDLTKGSDDYVLVLKKIAIEEDKLSNIQSKRVKSQGTVTKAIVQQKDATGSATAATMELSRVISDAPYGIRGMANNITQLVSQLGTASKSAGGLGAALKLMGSQLMGPLGVVFLITAAVSALDYFYGANKKAEESTKSLNDANTEGAKTAGKTATEFKILTDIVLDKTAKDKDQDKALKILNKKYKEFNTNLITNAKNLKSARKEVDKYTASLVVQAKAEAALDLIKEKQGKIFALEEETAFKIKEEGFENLKELDDEIDKQRERMTSGSNRGAKASAAIRHSNLINLRNSNKDEIEEINEQIDRLSNLDEIRKAVLRGGDKDGSKGSKFIDAKEFEANLFEIEKMIRSFRYRDLTESAKTEQEKAAAKGLIELDKFTSNYKEYTENENKKFAKFRENLDKQLEKRKISESAYNNALGLATDQKREKDKLSYENYLKGLKAISKKYAPDIIGEGITVTTTLAEQAKKDAKIKLNGQLDAFLEYAKSAKTAFSAINEFLQAESARELTIEQNKTNALNAELNQRLLNENLSKDERASIQNQIAINDEKLRVKQNEIKRKAFNTQKAFNIAIAVTDTISAGIGAARATYGGPIAKIAAMTATIGAGMLQVAMIARQKFQPDAANTPVNIGSSSGGGSARAEPSFNIVGRSNDNLIMSAIQSQFDQPLRAYVVARDVTNQQQLDGVISSSAST